MSDRRPALPLALDTGYAEGMTQLALAAVMKKPARMPGPSWLESLLTLPAFRRSPIAVLERWFEQYGDTVKIGGGPRTFHLFVKPEDVGHVLLDNHKNYSKQMMGYRKLALVLGKGLVTSDGEEWRMRRRTAQPAFHRARIASFAEQMTSATERMLDEWAARPDPVIDVGEEMMGLAFRIVGATLMSRDLSDLDERSIGSQVTLVMEYIADRMIRIVDWPEWIPTQGNLRFKRALAGFDALVYQGIRERARGTERPNDLLSMLLDARDPETGAAFTEAQIRDEVVTIMGAGHETTASTLGWTWHLLARHPQVEADLHQELACVLGGRIPTFDDLPQLGLTQCIIEEAMRLHPPVWILSRRALDDDEIGGRRIEKGSNVLLSPYLTHRHPDLWPDAAAFRPERFRAASKELMPRFAYYPFGGGPRTCIGNHFAMMEATLLLATIAQRFRLTEVSAPETEISVTLRPRGLRMRMMVRTPSPRAPRVRSAGTLAEKPMSERSVVQSDPSSRSIP